jgi:hypothetical protein
VAAGWHILGIDAVADYGAARVFGRDVEQFDLLVRQHDVISAPNDAALESG